MQGVLTMSTLDAYTRFLTARWDEQEQVARAAATTPARGRWPEEYHPHWYMVNIEDYDGGLHIARCETREEAQESLRGDLGEEFSYAVENDQTRHVTIHDPAYVLADLAAKRAVLRGASAARVCAADSSATGAYMTVARLLADPFRDHPDHPANQEHL